MKKVLILSISLLLFACSSEPFTGYVVAKEYIEGHMCHSEHKHTVKAIVHVPHVQHHHSYQQAQFILHVANRHEVRAYHVDTFKFNRVKMLDKITFRR